MARSAYREAVGYFEQALSVLPISPRRVTRVSRPSIACGSRIFEAIEILDIFSQRH